VAFLTAAYPEGSRRVRLWVTAIDFSVIYYSDILNRK